MNESEKIRRIKEHMKIKNKLNSIGICGIVGPTGPRGEPNGIGAYVERHSISNQRFNISANREIIIPLEATGPAIFASTDPVALDQACYDAVKNSKDSGKASLIERMDSRHAIHTVETAYYHNLGNREYEIINID